MIPPDNSWVLALWQQVIQSFEEYARMLIDYNESWIFRDYYRYKGTLWTLGLMTMGPHNEVLHVILQDEMIELCSQPWSGAKFCFYRSFSPLNVTLSLFDLDLFVNSSDSQNLTTPLIMYNLHSAQLQRRHSSNISEWLRESLWWTACFWLTTIRPQLDTYWFDFDWRHEATNDLQHQLVCSLQSMI